MNEETNYGGRKKVFLKENKNKTETVTAKER